MLLRMVRIQPPIEVTRIVAAGRIACTSTFEMNGHDHEGVRLVSYPKPRGSQFKVIENSRMAMSAIQKYGKAEVITKIGGKKLSKRPPRRHALTVPINVPRTNARTVVTPTRPSVHGRALSTTWVTDSGKNVMDLPKLPVKQLPRYWK